MHLSHDSTEQEVTLPETGGIIQQPTQEELSAIASSFDSSRSSSRSITMIFVAIGVAVVVLGAIASVWFMSNVRQEEIQVPQQETDEDSTQAEATISASIDEYSLLDHIFAGTFKDEFSGKMYSKEFDTQWKDRGLDFTMQGVHDLGVILPTEYAVPAEYIGKKVVVVELNVIDTRLTGEPVEVSADRYVATRYEQTDTPAANWREVLLNPGEEKTVFIPFVLDKKSQNYFILSGDLRNPFVSSMEVSVDEAP